MPKKKKKSRDKTKIILYGVILLLIILCGFLGLKLHNEDTYKASLTPAINVNLGYLNYTITNGKPVKNTNPKVSSLKSYLTKTAQKDIQLGCKTTYYRVIAANQDQTQVLLNYGCPYPNAEMFATYNNGIWKLISPTNEFDQFGIPSCDYVSQNKISNSVAPVCVNGLLQSNASLVYKAR